MLIYGVNANRALGLTFDNVAKALGRDEVWVAAAFYGQVRLMCLLMIGPG